MRRGIPAHDSEDTTLNDPIVTAKPDPEDAAVEWVPDNIHVMDPERKPENIPEVVPVDGSDSSTKPDRGVLPPELPADDSILEERLPSPPSPSVDLSGEMQELDFFLEERMHSEASFLFGELLEKHPNHPDLVARASQIQDDSP